MILKSSSAKYRPFCLCLEVLTRCGRDRVTSILKTTFSISILTWGGIWIRYKNVHTWKWIWKRHLEMAAMLSRLQYFEGETKWLPLSRRYFQNNFPVWNCFIVFQIWLQCVSKFPDRDLLYHFITLHWEGIKRRAQDDVVTWKRTLILVQWADHGSPWVPCAMGQWYRYIFARVSSLLPCSFYSHASKDKPKSNDMLTVIRFRVSYVHLSQILIFKKRKYHKKIEKKYLGMTMRSLGFQDFQQCCFRSPDWWSNATHWMGLFFLAIFLMV